MGRRRAPSLRGSSVLPLVSPIIKTSNPLLGMQTSFRWCLPSLSTRSRPINCKAHGTRSTRLLSVQLRRGAAGESSFRRSADAHLSSLPSRRGLGPAVRGREKCPQRSADSRRRFLRRRVRPRRESDVAAIEVEEENTKATAAKSAAEREELQRQGRGAPSHAETTETGEDAREQESEFRGPGLEQT